MKKVLSIIGVSIVIFFLWDTGVIYPLQLLVVFFHEASHALMTKLTGGDVIEMAIVKEQGGHVMSSGGFPFLITSAGYLGSLLIGCGIFMLSENKKYQKLLMAGLGIFVLGITVFFVRNWFGFGFSLLTGGLLLVASRFLNNDYNSYIMKIIGLTSILYVPHDIYSDTIQRSNMVSDARILAENYGGPTILWGSIWLLCSFAIIIWMLRWTYKRGVEEEKTSSFEI